MTPKVLFLDVETAPLKSYIWRMWQEVTSTDFITDEWYLLCWCAKWADEKRIRSSALPDFKTYKNDNEDDSLVMGEMWDLLDKADFVVAHNANKFDIKIINTRFILNGLPAPSPYRVIDTLTVARSKFKFTSNRLDYLGKLLGVGRKVKTGGFDLWKGCLNGDRKSWHNMVKYCKGDISLLEDIYYKLLPYITNHPNYSIYADKEVCVNCGSGNVHKRGFSYTNASKFQRYRCNDCNSWSRSNKSEKKNTILVGV